MSSSSSNDGSSTITVTFDVGYPINTRRRRRAEPRVAGRLVAAGHRQPDGRVGQEAEPPTSSSSSTSLHPTLGRSGALSQNYAALQILDPLKRVPGVGDVQVFGERRYSMRHLASTPTSSPTSG